MLAQLATPSKDRLKQDGLNVSLWMHSLSSFCGNLYKKCLTRAEASPRAFAGGARLRNPLTRAETAPAL